MRLIGVVPSWEEQNKITINQDYLDAVYQAGAMPVLLPITFDTQHLERFLDQVDGLLLTGGLDVDPSRYGEKKLPCCGTCSACRDRMEFPLCRMALERNIPILAICRGMQVLSCVLGGTLWEDIAVQSESTLLHARYDAPDTAVHEVSVRPGTLLHSIVATDVLPVNSRHHQGIRRLGEGLEITATAPDGLAEAVELPGKRFVLGVQWHPESLSKKTPAQQAIFDAFVHAVEALP